MSPGVPKIEHMPISCFSIKGGFNIKMPSLLLWVGKSQCHRGDYLDHDMITVCNVRIKFIATLT